MGLNEKFFKSADEEAEPFFNTVLWDGDSSTDRDITGVGFVPDLVWIKKRANDTKSHRLCDVVRGPNKILYSDLILQEASPTNEIKDFITDGFTIGNATSVNDGGAGDTYAAWCWKAGGAAVSNTDGNITSQVSANIANGFSIVKWSATTAKSDTLGHGLDSKPELVIMKKRSGSSNWFVYTDLIDGSMDYLFLNTTAKKANSTLSVPTSSLFTQGNLGGMVANDTCIAYCFHSVAGVSKVGSYTGTGLAGKEIILDFEPSWIMIKRDSTIGDNWNIIDNVRDTDTNKNAYLKANTDGIEVDSGTSITFNIDGFTLNGGSFNTSEATHIYYAIA